MSSAHDSSFSSSPHWPAGCHDAVVSGKKRGTWPFTATGLELQTGNWPFVIP